MFGTVGTPELLLIMLVILLLFGSKRLPELARGIGKGIRQFRKAMDDVKDEIDFTDIDRQIKE
ncbi:MAG: twin-arginine translocase TatA/TatE family subunit [candidate division KSB1 bacterium]|nr:twin-arginine translocase TatA/TatE family subunit [candidate division KSB1 bacterium]MDZ7335401.1 twin-arginine translocase TatA/TatE family subunit [candidate division KSB1 bacterium]MDZ7356419.1 twin-arginine translocase TatA/TatE family subunit [candidate division KSB1 bacterium]MDZ7401190.1 twin-arginine translocase TatA/TatE family subunit [candidate division KSB1 bacterium]